MENRTPREAALRDPSCERVAKTLQEKNPELASSHEHTKFSYIKSINQKYLKRASLVTEWLRIRLPM